VDEVARRMMLVGKGGNVPVHPRDRWLLGMRWEGETFVNGTLSFGLRSAPLIFTALGDSIQWVALEKGAVWLRHYGDDFISIRSKGSGECARSMYVFKETCAKMGMPLEKIKRKALRKLSRSWALRSTVLIWS